MVNRYFVIACVLCVVPGVVAPARAQGAHPTAVLTGTVQGPDRARLPGVVVTVTAAGRTISQVVSAEQGVFRVSALASGHYEVTATIDGFRTAVREIEVTDGPIVPLDIVLGLESLVETVTVVGSAERTTLEATRIRESGARDVGEALGSLAGVWKVRRGAIASDVVIRGYQGDNVTVLIDGARLYGACPNNMDPASFHVDFAEVDRIEIGKGPFDVKNQGGLGAAVNIVTRRPPAGAHANAQASVGSSGYVNPTGTASYGNGRWAILGGYSRRLGDAYRDGDGRSFLETANYRTTSLGSRAFDVNTSWVRVDAAATSSHGFQAGYTRQRAGTIMYPYLQMDAAYDNADRVNLGYDLRRAVGPVQAMRVQGYVTRVDHWMTDEHRVSSIGMARSYSMATLAHTATRGLKAEATVSGGTVGVETFQREWNAETQLAMTKYQAQFSIPDVTLMSVGVFAEFSRPLGNGLTVDVGGRVDQTRNEADASKANTSLYLAYHGHERTSATDTYPSGKVRVSYTPVANLTLNAGIGHTVRVPDPQERYFALKRSGSDWVGDPFLEPTANTGVELGAAYRAGRLFVNATIHRDALRNMIGVYQQPRVMAVAGVTNPFARSYRNVDATMSGAEVEAVVSVTDRLFLAGDVSAVEGRQHGDAATGVTTSWLADIPPARVRLALRYEKRGPRGSGFGEIETTYSLAQTRVDTGLRETPTPAYALTNARVGGSFRHVRLAAGIANLFNRTYVEHLSYQRDPFRTGAKVYEAGRNVYANMSVAF